MNQKHCQILVVDLLIHNVFVYSQFLKCSLPKGYFIRLLHRNLKKKKKKCCFLATQDPKFCRHYSENFHPIQELSREMCSYCGTDYV